MLLSILKVKLTVHLFSSKIK